MTLDDQFDRIPDSIAIVIFNKVADVRSLGRCSSVSKRFRSLVPLVHDVYLKIDRVMAAADASGSPPRSRKPRDLFTNLARLVLAAMLKPFHQLRGGSGGDEPLHPEVSRHSPAEVLKNFRHVRSLRIELPAGDVGTEDGVVLRWRAEFGSTLRSCVILGGTRVHRRPQEVEDSGGSMPDSFCTNGGLKLRVVWTICSLIAASTRHHLLRPIIEDHPTIQSLVLTDAEGQGTLSMGAEQLREFRENPAAASAASNRTEVPASHMKLRYAPFVELSKGVGMRGATLVAIRPSDEGCNRSTVRYKKEDDAFVAGAFEEPLEAAVKALVKRRTYLLEMNGF